MSVEQDRDGSNKEPDRGPDRPSLLVAVQYIRDLADTPPLVVPRTSACMWDPRLSLYIVRCCLTQIMHGLLLQS